VKMIATEFLHERYFKDVEAHVLQIFNQLPLKKQPRYIAQMGCGDGTFLKQLYQFIQHNSKRGRQLQKCPLTLMGIDLNPAALKETAKTLKGLPHMTLVGDIHDSQKLLRTLAAKKIKDTQAILYIRTFMDHSVRCDASQESLPSLEILASDAQGAYVDWSGNYLKTLQVLSAWKKHFESWSKLIDSGDLLLLQSHGLPSKETGKQLEASPNFHLDTLHAFSHEHLISAESFLILAAGVGLFAKVPPKRYPKTFDDCRATLTHFEKRNYRIRHAESRDLEILDQLESLCWSKETRTSKKRIHARIKAYPQGQFVLEREGRVVGVIYSQRIESPERLQGETASRVHSLHTPFGEVVQLLAINIHPEFQNLSLGDQLLEFMLQRCSLMKGVKSVCGVTICKEYHSGKSVPFAEYIHSRDEEGRIQDSVLSFHESHGASIEKALAGYRPKDVNNEGFGVLIHYDIHRRVPGKFKAQRKSEGQVSFSISHSSIQQFIRTTLLKYLGKEAEQAFSVDRPLMEMGLDSADLLQLQAQIVQKYSVELEPAFFFQYNTPEKVIGYLEEKRSDETQESPVLDTVSDGTKTVLKSKDIAIVGMSCKLPGNINTPDELWKLLERKGNGITELPQERFRWPEDIDPQGKYQGINLGGFIQNIACFDAAFFRIAAKEAEGMDPQQRILLELAWACLEEGGINRDFLKGSNTGVFIGASGSDYARLLQEERIEVEAHHGRGSSMAVLANRISYFFDFSGPSLQIDTACSSSLVAIHTAVQSLLLQECRQALVGGVHLICHPATSIAYYKAGMLARDGRCKPFDQKANGYVRSEGGVMLHLKPLQQAIQDRNLIHAVIKGSAINHGGLSGGLTVPNPQKQKELLANAWNSAGITPKSLGYIEAHGTGTALGDPIEIRGIQEAFLNFNQPQDLAAASCGVSSLKSNLGHLEAAAGIAGLLKAVLCLKHRQLLASPFFEKLNPEIQLENSPLYIISKHQEWNTSEAGVRRAAVSSFGSGGANAHVVLEEYPQARRQSNQEGPFLFTLSAKSKERLRAYAETMVSWLNSKEAEAVSLADIVYTLETGRSSMDERLSTVVSGKEELLKKLTAFCENEKAVEHLYHENIKNVSASLKVLTEGKIGEQLIQAAIQQNDLEKLATLWTAGVALDWDLLYKEEKPGRISLPTYPFAKERYWVPKIESQSTKMRGFSSRVFQEDQEDADMPELFFSSSMSKPSQVVLSSLSEEQKVFSEANEVQRRPTAETLSAAPKIQPEIMLTFEEPISKETIQKELVTSLAKALYLNPSDIDIDRQFVDMGLDSIVGVEWVQVINKTYELNLTATKVYDYPNICELAGFIEEEVKKLPKKSLHPPQVASHEGTTPDSLPVLDSLKKRCFASLSNGSVDKEQFIDRQESIAIIGMSGRYPGAHDLHEYWSNLVQGRNSVREIPKERWNVSRYYDPDPTKTGKVYCKWLGVLDDIECFDPLFFMISPTEAEGMDPQHRIFLEEGYKAFEDAGYSKSSLNNMKCGVYLGIMSNEYGALAMQNLTGQSGTNTSFAIGAARLPYYLNLKGPAIPIDTACSSSLVAAHLACQALLNGEINMALVGGVSLYLTPESYISMCAAGMLSPEGQCKAFDDTADGFVPGEGVGAIVLKRLKDAQRDNDFIWGTIIGSGINQDGKTNGMTAPSVNSQIELERGIYEKYNIDPGSITYIETHGTGTKLGDPIELEALSTVFKEKTNRRNYCALGSVKSNIGHSSAAAGVASIQKVLLSLKHKELAPSLHYKKPNSHFNLENSPFYVNRERGPWTREKGKPYRAAISAFGFSGTNAHMVIEEYVPEEGQESKRIEISPARGVIIVLSARNKERLRNTVQRLKEYISKELSHEEPSINLADLAYTLQVGREEMEERIGMVVHSLEELKEKLEEIMDEEKSVAAVYRGEVKRNKDALAVFGADEDLQKAMDAWIAKGKYTKILDLWVKGLIFDWNKLYGDSKPRRISLPTYPFARERYWLPTPATNEKVSTASIHPLLHQNTSNLSEQRFSSTFTGEEFFLTDHVVKGERVLPGVAYLEMARAAVAQGAGIPEVGQTGIKLKNVVWARPIVVGKEAAQVHIGLFPEDNKQIAYEIYSESAESGEDPVVHSQGSAVVSLDGENGRAQVPTLDLAALQAECSENKFSPTQCYEAFRAMGIDYGPGHQGIEEVHVGRGQVLAKLSLPTSVIDTQEQYVLHPSLMDSALQASIGLMMGMGDGKGALPFALQELEIFSRCPSTLWALIRNSDEGDRVQKFDIDLCDEAGTMCVRMKGFTSRVLEGEGRISTTTETLMLKPHWKDQTIIKEAPAPVYAQHLVLLCELNDISQECMEAEMKGVRCLTFKSKQQGIEKRFQSCASRAFEEIQSILKDKPNGPVLIQVVVPINEAKQLFSGLSGLLKTAQMENPKIIGQVIEVDDTKGIPEKLRENSRSPTENRIRYQDGKRWVASWREIKVSKEGVSIPWKEEGTYLITGGAGGLGFIFAKEIAEQAKNATVILTGRSALNATKQDQLKELESLGVRVEYKEVDVKEKKAVRNLMQSILEKFGRLDGIIHSAGVKRDNFIFKKTKEELEEVLAPKVAGLVNLDEAGKDLRLDFFILFSSSAGAMGNIGQADYATANAFMDAYAKYRNHLVASKQRYGQTLSINWPLWQEGGMRVDAVTEKMLM